MGQYTPSDNNERGQINAEQVAPLVKKKGKSGFLAAVGSFNIQYNFTSASIATEVMGATSYLPLALYPVPAWADQIQLSVVFVGVMVGTLLMGRLGDVIGRVRAMRVTIAFSSVGAVIPACAVGSPDMVYGMVLFGRFVLGIGVGGIFPLAAVSAAESTSDVEHSRSRSVARAFFWQTPGKLVPYLLAMALFGFIVPEPPVEWVPQMEFRLLFGLGLIPGIIVLIGSLSEEESDDFRQAQRGRAKESLFATLRALPTDVIWTLVGTGGTWFFFDVSYYGISIFTPAILDAICLSGTLSDNGCSQTLFDTAWQSLFTTFFQVPGVIAAIWLIDIWGSKRLNVYGSLLIAACCLAFAIIYATDADNTHALFGLYCVLCFALSFGPNLGCYVLPAICFPAHARSTCHGLSASLGKLGAVVGTFAFGLAGKSSLSGIFLANGVVAVLAALVSQICLRHDWEYLAIERQKAAEAP